MSPIRALPGLGPERGAQLERLKIISLEDLLLHRPHRYEDRQHFISIAELKLKEAATVRGTIVAQGLKYFQWFCCAAPFSRFFGRFESDGKSGLRGTAASPR